MFRSPILFRPFRIAVLLISMTAGLASLTTGLAAGEPPGEPAPEPAREPAPERAAGQTEGPANNPSQVRERAWHTSLDSARREAEADGKLIFVDLFAEWCGWCRVLDKNVFANPVFDSLAERLVLVRIDVEKDEEGPLIQSRYGVSGLPTTLILEASGVLVGKVTGVADAAGYVADIEKKIEGHRKVTDLYDRVIATQGSEVEPAQMQSLASAFHQRMDGARAAALYRLLETRGTEDPALLAFRLADALRLQGEYEAASKSTARARKLAKDHESGHRAGSLIEAIDLLDIQIATELGDCSRRRKTLETFLEHYPKSEHHRRIESTLVALENGTDGTGCSGA